MNFDWIMTLIALTAVVGLYVFAHKRAHQPAEPLKVRLFNYHYVQITCIVALLLVLAHLITLIAGHPLTGGQQNY